MPSLIAKSARLLSVGHKICFALPRACGCSSERDYVCTAYGGGGGCCMDWIALFCRSDSSLLFGEDFCANDCIVSSSPESRKVTRQLSERTGASRELRKLKSDRCYTTAREEDGDVRGSPLPRARGHLANNR